jgi:hypothetical protein
MCYGPYGYGGYNPAANYEFATGNYDQYMAGQKGNEAQQDFGRAQFDFLTGNLPGFFNDMSAGNQAQAQADQYGAAAQQHYAQGNADLAYGGYYGPCQYGPSPYDPGY